MMLIAISTLAAMAASGAVYVEGMVVKHPQWRLAPSFADLAAAYPRGAGGQTGSVVLRCQVQVNGALQDCVTASEAPRGEGFAAAAGSLAKRFRAIVAPDEFKGDALLFVNVPVRFVDPKSAPFRGRRIEAPYWVTVPSRAVLAAAFPPSAAAKGVTSGRGVAECVVDAHGALSACDPVSSEPDGLGFGEAAAKVAAGLRMSPWTDDGGPVDGAKVDVPIRFAPASAVTADDSP